LARSLAAPRYPGDLVFAFERDAKRAARRGVLLYAITVVIGLAIFAVGYPEIVLTVLGIWLALFGSIVAFAVPQDIWQRRRGKAINELILGWADLSRQEWDEIGAESPSTIDEGLAALEGRTDDLAVALRLSLVSHERKERAQEILDAGHPSDPVFRARRERVQSAMRFDADGTDDLTGATNAAAEIEDPAKRQTAEVLLSLERARRIEVRGGDPFPLLVETRRSLGPLDLRDIKAVARGPVSVRLGRTGLGCLLEIGHFVVIGGLAWLAVSLTGR